MPSIVLRRLCGAVLFCGAGSVQAGEITVSAAASLTNAFNDIARAYEHLHTDARVLLNFGASGALLQQMAKGAPVHVFASADDESMEQAVQQGLIGAAERKVFAHNQLVLIVPPEAKYRIDRLEDLGLAAVHKVAIGNPASVPVGRYTKLALERARLWNAVSGKTIQTQNVRQALDYVARGEVEAAFVYATDAMQFKDKVKVAMQVPLAAPISYPIARTVNASGNIDAKAFVAYVLSPAGQSVLAKYGFAKP